MQNNFFTQFLMISEWQTVAVLCALAGIFFILKKLKDRGVDFSIRAFLGLIFGVILGYGLQIFKGGAWVSEAGAYLDFFSSAFLGFIKMLVLPIIGVSIIKVLLDLEGNIKLGMLLRTSFFWILLSVGVAAALGVMLGSFFHVGLMMKAPMGEVQVREVKNILDILLNLIPSNFISAMSGNNIIAYVIFCFFIGFGARGLKRETKIYETFKHALNALYHIVMDMTLFVIKFMPYAVVCMIAEVLLSNGLSAIKSALSFIVLIYAAMVIMFIVHLIFIAINGLNPLVYARKAFPVWLFAFSSRSSVGTLPLTIQTLQTRLGVSAPVANFVASIGTSVGLNGCAGYFPALSAIFIANALGVEMNLTFYLMVVIVAMLGSLGIAGVPGSATMAASIMLTGLGFSEHFGMLSIILAIDPIVDMARTASNVSGAMTCSICTDRGLKTLNKEVYYSGK